MHVFPAKPNRLVLWIVALLVTCYFADWSDDYYSFAVSEQYASFQSANGWRPQVSGGGHINPSGLMASFRTVSRDGEQLPVSTMEAVFGSPLGNLSASPENTRGNNGTFGSSLSGGMSAGASTDSALSAQRRMSGSSLGSSLSGNNPGFSI